MQVTQQQAKKLLTGSQTFSLLGFSMMITRLKTLYARDPSKLESFTAEINKFMSSFSSVMRDDYAIISKL